MSFDSLVFWLFVIAWVVVAAMLLGLVLRLVGEARRVVGHVDGLVNGSMLPLRIAKAQRDAQRIEISLAQVSVLEMRVAAALTTIRETPLVPPKLVSFVQRVRAEIVAFRQATR